MRSTFRATSHEFKDRFDPLLFREVDLSPHCAGVRLTLSWCTGRELPTRGPIFRDPVHGTPSERHQRVIRSLLKHTRRIRVTGHVSQ